MIIIYIYRGPELVKIYLLQTLGKHKFPLERSSLGHFAICVRIKFSINLAKSTTGTIYVWWTLALQIQLSVSSKSSIFQMEYQNLIEVWENMWELQKVTVSVSKKKRHDKIVHQS